jgi:hypothetical protein
MKFSLAPDPLTQHADWLWHDTVIYSPAVPKGSEIGTIAHLAPFQRSASKEPASGNASYAPTTQQFAADEQLIPLASEAGGLGASTIDQALPFQCSIRIAMFFVAPSVKPAAQQSADDTQLTERKMSPFAVTGLGVDSTIQSCPFQRAE